MNDSFIPEFVFFNFVIRCAVEDKRLFRYKVRNGVTFVQINQDDKFIEIGHADDLVNHGIEIPPSDEHDTSLLLFSSCL